MSNYLLSDNSVKLPTPRRSNGKVGRLRIEWNTRRGSVGFSGQTQGGDWINAYLMYDKFINMCDDIKMLLNCKEEKFCNCDVEEGQDPKFAFRIGVGRDVEGVLYLEIAQPNKEAIRYLFLPERQYKASINGQPLTINEVSRRKASAWVQILIPTLLEESKAGKEAYQPKQGGGYQGNNSQGGYQKKPYNGGQQNGGYQKKPYNGGNGGYQKQEPAPVAEGSLDDYLTL